VPKVALAAEGLNYLELHVQRARDAVRSAQCAVQHIEHRREHWVHWVWPRRPSRQMSTGSKKSLIRSARNGHISPFHQNFSTYVNICQQFDWKALKGSGWSDWISAIMLRKFACHAWSTDGIGSHGHGHSTVTTLKFRFETSQKTFTYDFHQDSPGFTMEATRIQHVFEAWNGSPSHHGRIPKF
jgi:putative component of membrane protein insertase Oxa1/YidC/SpoIIIJ protein YidD